MEYALNLPSAKRSLVVPLVVAALLGAGVATTTYAVVDSGQASQPTVVVTHPTGGDATAQPQLMGGRRP